MVDRRKVHPLALELPERQSRGRGAMHRHGQPGPCSRHGQQLCRGRRRLGSRRGARRRPRGGEHRKRPPPAVPRLRSSSSPIIEVVHRSIPHQLGSHAATAREHPTVGARRGRARARRTSPQCGRQTPWATSTASPRTRAPGAHTARATWRSGGRRPRPPRTRGPREGPCRSHKCGGAHIRPPWGEMVSLGGAAHGRRDRTMRCDSSGSRSGCPASNSTPRIASPHRGVK